MANNIIETALSKIKEIIEIIPSELRLVALFMIISAILIGLSMVKSDPTIDILYPEHNQKVDRHFIIKGKSSNINNATESNYYIVMFDKDGDCYSQGKLNISKSGEWSKTLSVGEAWGDKTATIKVVSVPSHNNAICTEDIKSLTKGVSLLTEVIIDIQSEQTN